MIDKYFTKICDTILDFDSDKRTDAEFVEVMKDASANFLGEWTEEL